MKNKTQAPVKQLGSASLRVEVSNGHLVVRHGDTGEVLLRGDVGASAWERIFDSMRDEVADFAMSHEEEL